MKSFALISMLAAIVLTGCSNEPAGTGTTPSTQPTPEASANHDAASGAAVTLARAEGTVQTVDAEAGKISISHGPVEALRWPAMTMAFRATPEQIASVDVGQKVEFEFRMEGMNATITRIAPTP